MRAVININQIANRVTNFLKLLGILNRSLMSLKKLNSLLKLETKTLSKGDHNHAL